MTDNREQEPEVDLVALHAVMEPLGVGVPSDECLRCKKTIGPDATHFTGLPTPPDSDVAALIVACSKECRGLLEADGWHTSTPDEIKRLTAQAQEFGERRG